MGWWTESISSGVSVEKFVVDMIEENEVKVKASEQVGTTVYLAVESSHTGKVVGVIVLTEQKGNEVSYKIMDESVMPFYFGATDHILLKLSPTENKHALNWRKRCKEQKLMNEVNA